MSLQVAIDRVREACDRSSLDVRTLFNRPLPEIIVFAREHRISLTDLKAICVLMIEELDSLDLGLFDVAEELPC